MKRTPATLKAFLASAPGWVEADCFVINLPNGQTILATNGQWDITFLGSTPGWTGGQTTFRSIGFGAWYRGSITSESGFDLSANTMDLTCEPGDVQYPGIAMSIPAAAHRHLFDAATVWVYTAYMPLTGYGDVSAGIETKFQGTITTAKPSRTSVQFEVADPLFLLNMKVPSRVLQSNCPWSFADSNCGLAAANFTQSFTAATGSTTLQLLATALTRPAGYFAQGVVTCTAGANYGLSKTVKSYSPGVVTVMDPWIMPIGVGDTFSIIKGCDKTPTTCAGTTRISGVVESADFRTRFGGQPFTPPPTAAI